MARATPGDSEVTRRVQVLLFVFLALLAAAIHPGVVDNVDSRIILRTSERLLDDGSWSLGDVRGTYLESDEYGATGRDGERQMKFGPGKAVLDLPALAVGRAVLGAAGLDPHRAGEAAVAFSSCVWFAGCGVLVYRIARRRLGERTAVGAALLHCVASYGLVYGRSAYLETPLTFFTLLAWDAAMTARDEPSDRVAPWILGTSVAAVLWIKYAAVLLVAGIVPVLFVGKGRFRDGLRTTVRAAIPGAIGAAAWLALNAHRFGHPLSTGYAGSAKFNHPLLDGLASLLVSERGGWLFVAPCAIAGLAALPRFARRDLGYAVGAALVCVLTFPLYARFFSPYGGDAWGPRYLVPNAALLAVPAAAVLADALRSGGVRRAAAAALIAAGVAFQIAPCVTSFTTTWTAIRAAGAAERPGPLTARIAADRIAGRETSDLSAFGGPREWRSPESHRGPDWWVARVAAEIPRAAQPARFAWTVIAGGAVLAGLLLLRRTRSAA